MAVRVGIGYDVHRTAEGRPLVLGGVTFESPFGLEGHSDADVVCHAVADALLGALALGDIGTHFPPSDPTWRNASSLELLRLVRAMVEGHGARIVNVDTMVVCEAPRLAPRRDAMTVAIAQALRVGAQQVSIKATTHEGLGAIGRGEGIAAWAVAAVETA
uniref:2-C-methyl-D-erythritol 2,4-cyclodiphosphate synthase n=1 Tax=Eiseniibacteriota bacterium TaxID=2212470 RepID=A0A832I373_UNCEI